MKIDIIHELDGFDIDYTLKDGYAEVCCPFHADATPSGSISLEHGGFKCFACSASSQFVNYLSAALKKEPNLIRAALEERYGQTNDKTVPIEKVEKAFNSLPRQEYLLKQLQVRCVTDTIIKERRLGHINGRIIIPIYNKAGYVVNLRKYRPGGEQKSKVINERDHGAPPRLYPVDQLSYSKIALCGGEIKAIAAAHVLNKAGIGAICITSGEGNWESRLTPEFNDKTVYIIYDIDDAGVSGAEKVAHQLYTVTREVFIVKLPLDKDIFPTGDVNDFLHDEGDLVKLLGDLGTPWVPVHKRHLLNGKTTKVHISQAINAEFTAKRVMTDCVIAAMGEAPYSVPSVVTCHCLKDQEVCGVCPVMHDPEGREYELNNEDPAIMMMVGEDSKHQSEALKMALDIPTKCRGCSFNAIDHFHVEDVRLSPKLEISNREIQREMIPAYMLQQDLILNETYKVTGRMHPHPRNQSATLLISESRVADDALSEYQNVNPHELNIFKPLEWTVDSIQNKLDELYGDLSANVTGIFGRQRLHLAIDLAYHSVLFLDVFKKSNQTARKKGWVEILVMGDSSQGKSETTMNLLRHYKLGSKVDCKNATTAGLLGGVVTLANKNYVKWGAIPSNDKRLVVLEELKGMHPEVFASLTDMRSSGEAHVQKIQDRKTHARTRLVALSNPVGGRTMATYPMGVEAIRQLINGLEDIRRFDMALIVSNEEVGPDVINRGVNNSASVEHIYTSNLCQRLVLWAWTVDKVEFEDESYIMKKATELQKLYHADIPLICPGSTHEKLARLSAALAARTYSTDDYETLIVRKCHVDYIMKYLGEVYSAANFRYDRFSSVKSVNLQLTNEDEVMAVINAVPNPLLLGQHLLQVSGSVDTLDLQPWLAQDKDLADRFIGQLQQFHALKRSQRTRSFYLTPGLLKLLERMMLERLYDDKPEHIKGEF